MSPWIQTFNYKIMEQVFIVDDHSSVRWGVTALLEKNGYSVSAQAGTLQEARLCAISKPWTLAIVDLQLPDGDGLELVQELRDKGMVQPILVHSMIPDAAVAARVFKAGGNGFINKGSESDALIAAVKRVAAGGRYVSPAYAEELAAGLCLGGATNPHEKLSEREYKVMCYLAMGKTPTQVASLLDCNVNTISTYRARILKKLGLQSSMDIVRYALSRRLVTL